MRSTTANCLVAKQRRTINPVKAMDEWGYEEKAALARRRAMLSLSSTQAAEDAAMDEEDHCIGYLYRSVCALASINDEIWSRIAPQLSGYEKRVLAVRASYREEEICQGTAVTVAVPTNDGCENANSDVDSSSLCSEPQIAMTTITPQMEVKSFGAAVRFPAAIRKVVPVPHCDSFPKALLDHSATAEASLVLHPHVARPVLRQFHKYLQELHVFLGAIDAWIFQPQQDTMLDNNKHIIAPPVDIWEMEPCKNLPYQIYLGELNTLPKATAVMDKINEQLRQKHQLFLPVQKRESSLDTTQGKERCCEMEFYSTGMMDHHGDSSSAAPRPSSATSPVSTMASTNSNGFGEWKKSKAMSTPPSNRMLRYDL